MKWNEYMSICTETDREIVVEVDGKITKRYIWHLDSNGNCTYTIKEHGRVKYCDTFKMDECGKAQWKEDLERFEKRKGNL